MTHPTTSAAPRPVERRVYYVSDRPEAYEVWGEVGHEEAGRIGRLIAEHAGRHFPDIEFRVDRDWHVHDGGMEHVAAYIDDHLPGWVEEATGH